MIFAFGTLQFYLLCVRMIYYGYCWSVLVVRIKMLSFKAIEIGEFVTRHIALGFLCCPLCDLIVNRFFLKFWLRICFLAQTP